jgi:phosphomannomutase
MKNIEGKYGEKVGNKVDDLDGLTVTSEKWWFNVRASNTEPVLRLNVEADTPALMKKIRDEVLATIRA